MFPDLTNKITARQITYLLKEHLPIPKVMVKIEDPKNPHKHKYVKKYSTLYIPVRYLMPKLYKAIPAFRGITACCGTTTEEGVAKIVNAVLVGIRPVLGALWHEECIRIDLVANKCWITSGGAEIANVMKDLDHKATMAKTGLPHYLETFHFVAMYANIPVKCLKRIMGELLDLVFTYQEAKDCSKSMYTKYGFKNDEKEPQINKINCPVNANEMTNTREEFNVGQAKLCEWINLVLDEGFI